MMQPITRSEWLMRLRTKFLSTTFTLLLLLTAGSLTGIDVSEAGNRRRHSDDIEVRHNRRNFYHRIYKGTMIPARTLNQNRFVFRRDEEVPFLLQLDSDIRASNTRYAVIPQGSWISGILTPRREGTQFEADRLYLRDGRAIDMRARSTVIYPNRRRRFSSGNIIFSKAARILVGSSVREIGNSDWGERVGQNSWPDQQNWQRSRRDLIVIYPNQDLDLRLRSDLKIP